MTNIERKIRVQAGFEPRFSGFTHRCLNQLDYRGIHTNSETNLSLSLSLSLIDTHFSLNIYHLLEHRLIKFSILISFRTS